MANSSGGDVVVGVRESWGVEEAAPTVANGSGVGVAVGVGESPGVEAGGQAAAAMLRHAKIDAMQVLRLLKDVLH